MSDGSDGRTAPGFQAGVVLEGRYLLQRPLGQGGMGSVWVARQIALDREVAVKVLHPDREGASAGATTTSRLRREALALAAVHHPAVVEVYDYGETEAGVPYVVMELVRGESLADLLRRGALPAEEAVALVLPLLDGLAAVHRAGIVHRDIKPENVLIAEGPSGPTPKLLDFGIARASRDAGGSASATAIVGTPSYMAPEQAKGVAPDERTDVWAVGVLLYELVAGVAPFGSDAVFAVLRRVLDEPVSYPRKAQGVDGKLWIILTGALRKDPAERTPSARALRDALAAWLDARPRSARPGAVAVTVESAGRSAPTLEAPAAAPPSLEETAPSIDGLIRAKLGAG